MARSATLNPASMPFFPGGRSGDDEGANGLGLGQHPSLRLHEQDRSSSSTLSVSPSDYRSVKSSPSPSLQQERNNDFHTTSLNEGSRKSPTFRQVDASKPYPGIESRIPRESSMLGTLESLPEGEDTQNTPGPLVTDLMHRGSVSSFFSVSTGRERLGTPPMAINTGSPFNANTVGFTSSSPVSSLDSGSHFAPSVDSLTSQTFEAQLKGSPLFHDILDRLVRCEFATTQIQKDLGDLHRKMNLLVERSLQANAQPEFKDPFASSSPTNFGSALNGSRASVGNIAPNQVAPADDISTISQRLNTLTSSVGQLLALQTQQIQTASVLPNQALVSSSSVQMGLDQGIVSNAAMLGHGLPARPDARPSPRIPNPPMRTWSTGTLDLPVRPEVTVGGRQDGPLRDKRRSVTGLLRRDSSGAFFQVVDPQGDFGGGSRDSGPLISKWEQLNLAPELLRSLNKFGVGPPNKIQQRALPFLLRGADIIAQAPPTQERIAAYVIPAIQIAVTTIAAQSANRGPIVIMISTTVDQATQAQRMIRDLGGPIGVRSALGVGTTTASSDLAQELRLLQQNMPHILCGTPQKLHALFTTPGGLTGSEVRFLVLDEVDQLIARNLHEFVFNIVKLLPSPRSRPLSSGTPGSNATPGSTPSLSHNFDASNNGLTSPFISGRRFSTVASSESSGTSSPGPQNVERQTALFSNTVPQDVLNLATAIQLREPVRVLVRRDGNVTQAETTQGSRGLRQFYLYLAFTAGGRPDPSPAPPGGGLGIIGSGRGAVISAESVQAREWKLDALADLFDDIDVAQAIVHVGGMTALDAVVYKLASRGLEAVPLHGDMNAGTKLAALNKYRTSSSLIMRQSTTKVLVVYDVQVKELSHIPLVINYDLPKAVEEYAHRVAPAIAPNNYTRAGVVINFVTATGGDVEMLRSIECFYNRKFL
ncbi:translation initiation factor [Moniliophthora roreri]|nr:translation initiation factor [Moniliophthora roreri]